LSSFLHTINQANSKLIVNYSQLSQAGVKTHIQLKDALQLIAAVMFEPWQASEHTQCGAAEGVAGRPVPTPPAQGIKDAAAGAQTERQQLTSHQTIFCNVDQSPQKIRVGIKHIQNIFSTTQGNNRSCCLY